MSVKLVLLKSGESVLTDLKEIVKDEEIKGYVFENPLVAIAMPQNVFLAEGVNKPEKLDIRLESWMPLSIDKRMVVPKDWIVTYVNPIKDLVEMYEECTNGTDGDQVSSTEE